MVACRLEFEASSSRVRKSRAENVWMLCPDRADIWNEEDEEVTVSTVYMEGREEEAYGSCPGLPHTVTRWTISTYPRLAPDPLQYPYLDTPH